MTRPLCSGMSDSLGNAIFDGDKIVLPNQCKLRVKRFKGQFYAYDATKENANMLPLANVTEYCRVINSKVAA